MVHICRNILSPFILEKKKKKKKKENVCASVHALMVMYMCAYFSDKTCNIHLFFPSVLPLETRMLRTDALTIELE